MINSIPVEIQQLILIHLPVDKHLANAPWILEDMVFVQQHMQAAVDRKEVVFKDWIHMPPFYRAACLSQETFWEHDTYEFTGTGIGYAVFHGLIPVRVPRNSLPSNYSSGNQFKNIYAWAAARGVVDVVALLLLCDVQTSEVYIDITPSSPNANPDSDPAIDGNAVLDLACWSGNTKETTALLQDPKVDPNDAVGGNRASQQVQRHNKNMLAASSDGHEDVVQIPVSESTWDLDKDGDVDNSTCVGYLVTNGRARATWKNSGCLRQACNEGHLVAVQLLLSITDVDINAYEVTGEGTISSPLREAQKNGHTDVVEYLLKDPRLDMDSIANKDWK
ncbi:hypothetical protein HDU77_007687 [Chytriomyces hyalinus]|nr:hypothetical protein HDU77_007687 [Chytriomyces hyalinus]